MNGGKFNNYEDNEPKGDLFERLSYLTEGEIADLRVECLIDKHYAELRIRAMRKDGGSEAACQKQST
jgi:hypothetical protein